MREEGRERKRQRGEKKRGSGGSVWETQMGQKDGQNNDERERETEREMGEGGMEGMAAVGSLNFSTHSNRSETITETSAKTDQTVISSKLLFTPLL